jgi:hypothetical protein
VPEGSPLCVASEALVRQLLEITGRPLFCGNGEEPWGEDDPESETERRKQGPDRRPGTCRRFRFTYDALAALPPHPREHRAGQTEYRDAQVGGLCLSVGRTGLKHFPLVSKFPFGNAVVFGNSVASYEDEAELRNTSAFPNENSGTRSFAYSVVAGLMTEPLRLTVGLRL